MQAFGAAVTLRQALQWLTIALLLTVGAVMVVAPWDLEIALAHAATRESTFGWLVQRWGRAPAALLIVAAAYVLANRALRLRRPGWARAARALLVQVVLHAALLTNLLKLLAGRIRPLQLGPRGEGFMPLFVWHPGAGDFSFPSGHVAAAMVLAPLVLLLWRARRYRAALLLAALDCLWAGAVTYGRVSYGAHFVSDVLFSVGLGVALAPLSVYLGDRLARPLA